MAVCVEAGPYPIRARPCLEDYFDIYTLGPCPISAKEKGMVRVQKPRSKDQNNKNGKKSQVKRRAPWKVVHAHAGGIDLASRVHYAAVGHVDKDKDVRSFGTTTRELRAMAHWLKESGVDTVTMEATGVYWIPPAQILEKEGLAVVLVHAAHVKGVPGKKTDVLDCMWLQKLHTFGLLKGCFRPKDEVNRFRTYMRRRSTLIRFATTHIHHLQKALDQMNVLVHRVLSDITGKTGMKIIRAIVAGKTNPEELVKLRHGTCKRSPQEFIEALSGDFRDEHVFTLSQALAQYDFTQEQIMQVDQELERYLKECQPTASPKGEAPMGKLKKGRSNDFSFNGQKMAYDLLGIDLTQIDGMGAGNVLTLLSETGWTLEEFETSAKFCSWATLCCGNNKSGEKSKSGKTRKSSNRAAMAFRMAAQSVHRRPTPMGDFFRRMRARLGPAKAVTATAHKMARIYYSMVKERKPYNPDLLVQDEVRRRQRSIKNLNHRAKRLGLSLVDPSTGEIMT